MSTIVEQTQQASPKKAEVSPNLAAISSSEIDCSGNNNSSSRNSQIPMNIDSEEPEKSPQTSSTKTQNSNSMTTPSSDTPKNLLQPPATTTTPTMSSTVATTTITTSTATESTTTPSSSSSSSKTNQGRFKDKPRPGPLNLHKHLKHKAGGGGEDRSLELIPLDLSVKSAGNVPSGTLDSIFNNLRAAATCQSSSVHHNSTRNNGATGNLAANHNHRLLQQTPSAATTLETPRIVWQDNDSLLMKSRLYSTSSTTANSANLANNQKLHRLSSVVAGESPPITPNTPFLDLLCSPTFVAQRAGSGNNQNNGQVHPMSATDANSSPLFQTLLSNHLLLKQQQQQILHQQLTPSHIDTNPQEGQQSHSSSANQQSLLNSKLANRRLVAQQLNQQYNQYLLSNHLKDDFLAKTAPRRSCSTENLNAMVAANMTSMGANCNLQKFNHKLLKAAFKFQESWSQRELLRQQQQHNNNNNNSNNNNNNNNNSNNSCSNNNNSSSNNKPISPSASKNLSTTTTTTTNNNSTDKTTSSSTSPISVHMMSPILMANSNSSNSSNSRFSYTQPEATKLSPNSTSSNNSQQMSPNLTPSCVANATANLLNCRLNSPTTTTTMATSSPTTTTCSSNHHHNQQLSPSLISASPIQKQMMSFLASQVSASGGSGNQKSPLLFGAAEVALRAQQAAQSAEVLNSFAAISDPLLSAAYSDRNGSGSSNASNLSSYLQQQQQQQHQQQNKSTNGLASLGSSTTLNTPTLISPSQMKACFMQSPTALSPMSSVFELPSPLLLFPPATAGSMFASGATPTPTSTKTPSTPTTTSGLHSPQIVGNKSLFAASEPSLILTGSDASTAAGEATHIRTGLQNQRGISSNSDMSLDRAYAIATSGGHLNSKAESLVHLITSAADKMQASGEQTEEAQTDDVIMTEDESTCGIPSTICDYRPATVIPRILVSGCLQQQQQQQQRNQRDQVAKRALSPQSFKARVSLYHNQRLESSSAPPDVFERRVKPKLKSAIADSCADFRVAPINYPAINNSTGAINSASYQPTPTPPPHQQQQPAQSLGQIAQQPPLSAWASNQAISGQQQQQHHLSHYNKHQQTGSSPYPERNSWTPARLGPSSIRSNSAGPQHYGSESSSGSQQNYPLDSVNSQAAVNQRTSSANYVQQQQQQQQNQADGGHYYAAGGNQTAASYSASNLSQSAQQLMQQTITSAAAANTTNGFSSLADSCDSCVSGGNPTGRGQQSQLRFQSQPLVVQSLSAGELNKANADSQQQQQFQYIRSGHHLQQQARYQQANSSQHIIGQHAPSMDNLLLHNNHHQQQQQHHHQLHHHNQQQQQQQSQTGQHQFVNSIGSVQLPVSPQFHSHRHHQLNGNATMIMQSSNQGHGQRIAKELRAASADAGSHGGYHHQHSNSHHHHHHQHLNLQQHLHGQQSLNQHHLNQGLLSRPESATSSTSNSQASDAFAMRSQSAVMAAAAAVAAVASKRYHCDQCSKAFTRSDMLTRHRRLHSGDRPFQCSECKQEFSRSDHLSTHMRTHTGEKPYKCKLCPYSACRKDMITRHMKVHNRSSPNPVTGQATPPRQLNALGR